MIYEPLRVMSMDEMEKIHQAALTILDEVGMRSYPHIRFRKESHKIHPDFQAHSDGL